MRLFIAINFDNKIKNVLYHSIQELKRNSVSGNFTPEENLHLTVVFIGETNKTELVTKAMEQAVSNMNPSAFYLNLRGMGKFKRREGDIYWVGVEKEKALWSLQRELTKELTKVGFAIEDREFVPHLTMGRKVMVKEGFSEEDLNKTLGQMSMEVRKISLMKSERVGNRQVYTEIYNTEF
jgi:2'-5' RNA ligase